MIAKTPPMGWNSWDCYGAAVNEEIVRANAEYMSENLKDYGWEYIVVDIQWYEPNATSHEYNNFTNLEVDEYSRLIPAVNRFPSAADGNGFKSLADYVHKLGLKFGIHIMRGIPRQTTFTNSKIKGVDYSARDIAKFNSICNWNSDMYGVVEDNEGSQAYYDSLFEMYASWGVDFVKVDDIANFYPKYEVEMIRNAIDKCGREMVLSLSPGPAKIEEAEHLKRHANMWRITDDFWDKWELLYEMFERADTWSSHFGPGHWPDADMLPLGAILQDYDSSNWTKFTADEQIMMMNLWAIIRSPLMFGGDMRFNDQFTNSLLTNKHLLEMHQHSRGSHQLFRYEIDQSEIVCWCAQSKDNIKYIGFFNIGESEISLKFNSAKLDLEATDIFFDIWSEQSDLVKEEMAINLKQHQSVVYKITKKDS